MLFKDCRVYRTDTWQLQLTSWISPHRYTGIGGNGGELVAGSYIHHPMSVAGSQCLVLLDLFKYLKEHGVHACVGVGVRGCVCVCVHRCA